MKRRDLLFYDSWELVRMLLDYLKFDPDSYDLPHENETDWCFDGSDRIILLDQIIAMELYFIDHTNSRPCG